MLKQQDTADAPAYFVKPDQLLSSVSQHWAAGNHGPDNFVCTCKRWPAVLLDWLTDVTSVTNRFGHVWSKTIVVIATMCLIMVGHSFFFASVEKLMSSS